MTMQQAHIACQVTSHTTCKTQPRQTHQLQVQLNISVQEQTTRGNTTCQPQLVQHSTNNNITMPASTHSTPSHKTQPRHMKQTHHLQVQLNSGPTANKKRETQLVSHSWYSTAQTTILPCSKHTSHAKSQVTQHARHNSGKLTSCRSNQMYPSKSIQQGATQLVSHIRSSKAQTTM
jgi:hypothetical protein